MKIGYIRVSIQEQNTMRQEVLVESISRFARNTKDLLELVEQLTAIEARKRLGISKAEAFEKLSELMSALRAVGSSYFIQWTQTRGSRCASVEGH